MPEFKNYGRLAVDLLLFVCVASVLYMLLLFTNFWIPQPNPLPSWAVWMSLCHGELSLLIAVLAASAVVFRWRKAPFSQIGLRLIADDYRRGFLFGLVLISVGFGINLAMGDVVLEEQGNRLEAVNLLAAIFFCLIVALSEEIAVRGFVLGRMLDAGINRYAALFFSSLLFSLMHLFNPHFAWLPFLNVLLAGVLLGASYIYTRNLCFPIGLHWAWNLAQGPIFGYQVSGNDFCPPVLPHAPVEANLWNGGDFGFEGSLLCTLLLLVAIVMVLRAYGKVSNI